MIILTPKGENTGFSKPEENAPNEEENPAVRSTIPPSEERVSLEDVPF